MPKKLDTAPYKGVRDFYPEDMWMEKYLFEIMRKTAESFGYVEYGSSPLEPADLYKAKSGEEIVSEQTYTFFDRGEREVTLRPEMTPTVARLVAGRKRELGFPLRWYSIANLFRYENPQRGRLREHYQLNVDIFGVESLDAETEVISLASKLLRNFGASDNDFTILINSRKLINDLFDVCEIPEKNRRIVTKIIDKKEKIKESEFRKEIEELLGDKAGLFISCLESSKKLVETLGEKRVSVKQITNLIEKLSLLGIKNVRFMPTLMRGFDYYTDIVFEIFDTQSENKRSLFGGGRYDNLTELFNNDKIPAFGFGMGDVTLLDFLETHKLLPKYKTEIDFFVASISEKENEMAIKFGQKMRLLGANVAVDTTPRKMADKIKTALKHSIPYFIGIGEEEASTNTYKIKNLETEQEQRVEEKDLEKFIADLK